MLQSPQLHAVTMPLHEHHVGKIDFIKLVTPDLAATEKFYSELFGWVFRSIAFGSMEYSLATLNGQRVAGLIHKVAPQVQLRQPMWLALFAVSDVDATKKEVLEHGGKVLFEPRTFPGYGCEALLEDPQGAVFGILASSSGESPDFLAAPGELIWSSLVTNDPEAAAAFYKGLFDYRVLKLPIRENTRHLLFASGSYPRMGATPLSPGSDDGYPYWLHYFCVEDAVQMAEKAVALGGRIRVQPRIGWHGGKLAVVGDPMGAVLGLLER